MELRKRTYDGAWMVWKQINGVWNIIYVTSHKATADEIVNRGLRWPHVSLDTEKKLAHMFR